MGVKISGGMFKGRNLSFPEAAGLRPTSSRVREAIFSALTANFSLEGTFIADFFAGSGVLGFEALSRGAASAMLIERNKGLLAAMEKNSSLLGVDDQLTMALLDIEKWIDRPKEIFFEEVNFVFIDPPYELDLRKQIAARLVSQLLRNSQFCKNAVFIIEQSVKAADLAKSLQDINAPAVSSIWCRDYGDTRVTFLVDRDRGVAL